MNSFGDGLNSDDGALLACFFDSTATPTPLPPSEPTGRHSQPQTSSPSTPLHQLQQHSGHSEAMANDLHVFCPTNHSNNTFPSPSGSSSSSSAVGVGAGQAAAGYSIVDPGAHAVLYPHQHCAAAPPPSDFPQQAGSYSMVDANQPNVDYSGSNYSGFPAFSGQPYSAGAYVAVPAVRYGACGYPGAAAEGNNSQYPPTATSQNGIPQQGQGQGAQVSLIGIG
jgi:hypothetical protein